MSRTSGSECRGLSRPSGSECGGGAMSFSATIGAHNGASCGCSEDVVVVQGNVTTSACIGRAAESVFVTSGHDAVRGAR